MHCCSGFSRGTVGVSCSCLDLLGIRSGLRVPRLKLTISTCWARRFCFSSALSVRDRDRFFHTIPTRAFLLPPWTRRRISTSLFSMTLGRRWLKPGSGFCEASSHPSQTFCARRSDAAQGRAVLWRSSQSASQGVAADESSLACSVRRLPQHADALGRHGAGMPLIPWLAKWLGLDERWRKLFATTLERLLADQPPERAKWELPSTEAAVSLLPSLTATIAPARFARAGIRRRTPIRSADRAASMQLGTAADELALALELGLATVDEAILWPTPRLRTWLLRLTSSLSLRRLAESRPPRSPTCSGRSQVRATRRRWQPQCWLA